MREGRGTRRLLGTHFQPFNCYSKEHKFTLWVYAVHFKLKIQLFVPTCMRRNYETKQFQEEMSSRPVPQTFLKGGKIQRPSVLEGVRPRQPAVSDY